MPHSADSPVMDVIETIRQRYPDAPYLALGQTALWDEPVKAVWRRLLDRFAPESTLIAAVHDTDYFAKTAAHLGDNQKYVALPHDDGQTRDLWSAAGELSAFFGSESVPTRQMYLSHNVPFDWLAKWYPGGKEQLYADKTEAWGWRGLVSTASHSVIAHDIPVLDIKDALLAQIDWGSSESLAALGSPNMREAGAATAEIVRRWVAEFVESCTASCRLSDLYKWLLPRFYSLLMAASPSHFETTASTELFRFNSQTCGQRRFQILQLFLDPKTRQIATEAYNRAVVGSGIYTLDGFGDGALPFDVVIPGQGRGTLRLLPSGIAIATTPTETRIDCGRISTVQELAAILESAFGLDAVVVGKAVTLIDMLSAEFLVIFHETASGYTSATQKLNARLAENGIAFDSHPLIRLAYPTWDALAALPSEAAFHLPPHLAAAFGTEKITAAEFAAKWHAVVEDQRQLIQDSQKIGKIRDLMTFLEGRDRNCWCERREEYEAAMDTLKEIARKSATLLSRIAEHREELQVWRTERQTLEQRMGDDWRRSVAPLREKIREAAARGEDASHLERDYGRQIAIRATAFEEPLHICKERITATRILLAEFRRQRRLLERSREATMARETIRRITWDAQLARLDLVRDAFLTIEGLQHTNLRPTAWWLPMVDPSGAWFNAIAEGAQARLEFLTDPAIK